MINAHLQWEKGCELLKNAASSSSEGHVGPSPGLSKDIQYELTSNNMDNFQKNSNDTFSSTVSHTVMPLQSLTNEGYRVCPPEVSGTTGAGSIPYVATSLAVGALQNVGLQDMHAMGNVGHLTGKFRIIKFCCHILIFSYMLSSFSSNFLF